MTTFGPGMLAGCTFSGWLSLLRDPELTIDAACLPRAAAITLQSLRNSLVSRFERARYDAAVRQTVLKPPLFILGHWRSGTTHLHQLIAQDSRFGFPNAYQASFPHVFLTTERLDRRWMSALLPRERPMDNMELSLSAPSEDEFALGAATLCSPCLAWTFPRQRHRFEKYLSFQEAAPGEVARWREALVYFLKKVQWRCGHPLVLKSPPHTARIRLLRAIFPDAKFVHIHRDPYRVFQSSQRTLTLLLEWHRLQRPGPLDMDDWVLRQYRTMYDAFFEQRALIPASNFYEMGFEKLEQDPIGELRSMYEALGLPDFSVCEPAVRRYLKSLSGYQKNTFSELPEGLKNRISTSWARCFDEWGYSKQFARTT